MIRRAAQARAVSCHDLDEVTAGVLAPRRNRLQASNACGDVCRPHATLPAVLDDVADTLRPDFGLDDLVRREAQDAVATLAGADAADRRSELPARLAGLHFLRADFHQVKLVAVDLSVVRRQQEIAELLVIARRQMGRVGEGHVTQVRADR